MRDNNINHTKDWEILKIRKNHLKIQIKLESNLKLAIMEKMTILVPLKRILPSARQTALNALSDE